MNNRIIKFRVWDNLKKEWCNNQLIWRMKADINSYATIAPPGIYFAQHPDGLTIQQFTGLKDKNGRDIYEGDIYKLDGWESFYFCYWHDGLYWNRRTGQTYNDFLEEHVYVSLDSKHYLHTHIEYLTVIGNVLENPELLK